MLAYHSPVIVDTPALAWEYATTLPDPTPFKRVSPKDSFAICTRTDTAIDVLHNTNVCVSLVPTSRERRNRSLPSRRSCFKMRLFSCRIPFPLLTTSTLLATCSRLTPTRIERIIPTISLLFVLRISLLAVPLAILLESCPYGFERIKSAQR